MLNIEVAKLWLVLEKWTQFNYIKELSINVKNKKNICFVDEILRPLLYLFFYIILYIFYDLLLISYE